TLLRVLDERLVRRLGSDRPLPVDARLVAGTRRDLAEEVALGRFRQDLYYRLNVIQVELPPLRTRRGDLPALCTALLRELGVTQAGPIEGENLARLEAHPWPGNVRELKNALERALVKAPGVVRFVDL